MGFAKQNELNYTSHGLVSVPDKYVCLEHFTDKSIIKFIKSNQAKKNAGTVINQNL